MDLQSFSRGDQSLPVHEIAGRPNLVRDIQAALIASGILEPPVDGILGAVTQWALSDYLETDGEDGVGRLTPARAGALLAAAGGGLRPLALGGVDLATLAAAAMQRRGYWIARHPDCVTIAYFEGATPDGNVQPNRPNAFNDLRVVFRIDGAGRPELLGKWEGTTEPGRYWTEHPMNPAGAARIAFSQRKAWAVGTHHPNTPGAHEALVQVDRITVYRDANRDFRRDGDKMETGLFAINQHWGYDLPHDDIGRAGAGCLVGRTRQGHREFMAIVKRDARHQASAGYRFLTAVMPGAALHEASFNPSDPH